MRVDKNNPLLKAEGLAGEAPGHRKEARLPKPGTGGQVSRPSWDDYFFKIAQVVSGRSTCLRRQTGAVLVKDKRILATGYNGAPAGLKHCLEIGCLREQKQVSSGEKHELCRGLHAEQNAIIQAALHGVEIGGARIYCTHQPCVLCAKMLINAGIRRIDYLEGYPDPLAKSMLVEAGVKLKQRESIAKG